MSGLRLVYFTVHDYMLIDSTYAFARTSMADYKTHRNGSEQTECQRDATRWGHVVR